VSDRSDGAQVSTAAYVEDPVQADHIGALLCATRMRAGGDLQEIARILKIRYSYLVAIEDSRFEDLPGTAYSIGFVRAYADYLGLDGDTVVRRLREEMSGAVAPARFEFSVQNVESGLPNGGLLAIAVVLGMFVYSGWFVFTKNERNAVDLIQEVPERLAILIDEPVTSEPMLPESEQPSIQLAQEDPQASVPVTDAPPPADDVPADQDIVTAAAESSPVQVMEDANSSVGSADPEPEAVAAADESEATQEGVSRSASQTEPERASEPVETVPATVPNEVEVATIVEVADPAEQETTSAPNEASSVAPVDLTEVDASPAQSQDTQTVEVNAQSEVSEPELPTEPEVAAVEAEREAIAAATEPTEAAAEEDSLPESDSAADAEDSLPLTEVADASDAAEDPVAAATSADVDNPVIELRAKSDSWIQVRDGNDLLLTRLLRKGEVYRVPDRSGLTLMTGNAGGLEVFVGGDLAPALGNEGVVRRGVPLNAESLREGLTSG